MQEFLQQMFRKFLDLKSSSEQKFSKNCRWVPMFFRLLLPSVISFSLHVCSFVLIVVWC